MFHRRHILSVGAAVALGACATSPTVQTDADPTADFSGYRNYMWAYSAPQPGVNALI